MKCVILNVFTFLIASQFFRVSLRDELLLENKQLQAGNSYSSMHWVGSHHCTIDHFTKAACPQEFYSLHKILC